MADVQILRDRVLSEAEAAFLEQGFFGVSMRQVALNAGVHPGTVTTLFGNKRNLLRIVEARLNEKQGRPIPRD
jgi:AcrR family transcriptional regulator